MSVTIHRITIVDDDGTGTYGTAVNGAFMTALYDDIDAALAALLPLAGGTLVGDLKFTDATYDIGKSGATRPRDGSFSRNLEAGGKVTVTGGAGGASVVIPSTGRFYLDGLGNTFIEESSADNLSIVVGGTTALGLTASTATLYGKAISLGASDSGGTGYKLLRVPN